jgi:hypothetical protein
MMPVIFWFGANWHWWSLIKQNFSSTTEISDLGIRILSTCVSLAELLFFFREKRPWQRRAPSRTVPGTGRRTQRHTGLFSSVVGLLWPHKAGAEILMDRLARLVRYDHTGLARPASLNKNYQIISICRENPRYSRKFYFMSRRGEEAFGHSSSAAFTFHEGETASSSVHEYS